MNTLKSYARAAHFGPTMLITSISFLLANQLWQSWAALLTAFTILLGQLLIGWSNDLFDYQDDSKHRRVNKPLVLGSITVPQLRRATFTLLPIAVVAIFSGPLGRMGGLLYLLGVGCGIAYNFYFKFSPLSPLPYAIACAALPACIFLSAYHLPPSWVLIVGGLLGVAFHFANVLKDLNQDVESEIKGLPQRLGKTASTVIMIILLMVVIAIVIKNPVLKDLTDFKRRAF